MKRLLKNKQVLLIIAVAFVSIITLVGTSYAVFTKTLTGTKKISIQTGTLKVDFADKNVISLNDAAPLTDTQAASLTPYTFTITNTGDIAAYYTISLDRYSDSTLDDKWVKYRITGDGYDTGVRIADYTSASTSSDGASIMLVTGEKSLDVGKSITYKLYLWLSNDADNTAQGKTFKSKISVNGYSNTNPLMCDLNGDGKITKDDATLLHDAITAGGTYIAGNSKYFPHCDIDGNGKLQTIDSIQLLDKANSTSSPTKVATKLLNEGVGTKGAIDTTDSEQTFITGTNPNNYIWYSGKLWRAVSIDPSDNSVKLVTQWNISAIPYNASGNTAFEGSYMQQWLNDTTVDGFLGNLRDYEKFIKTDSMWNATMTEETTKPAKTTMVTSAVGLLNVYEYESLADYLNNNFSWWTLTPYDMSNERYVSHLGGLKGPATGGSSSSGSNVGLYSLGVRPAINLRSSVEIVSGTGTASDPYRLKGDNDTPTTGTKLVTRYSGEYIRFGTGENNLYQIVSHETKGMTKIVSAIPLKSNGSYKTMAFASPGGSGVNYSRSNTIGAFLNGEYLTSGNYLTTAQVNMIEDNTTWYLGTVRDGTNYKLAKYASTSGTNLTSNTTTTKVGLLRLGELNSGQFTIRENDLLYWLLTPYNTSKVFSVIYTGVADQYAVTGSNGIRPTFDLKSNVVITGGDGTKETPFTVKLGS